MNETSSKVFVFVDNSNSFIEGKRTVSSLELPGQRTNAAIRIEFGNLVKTVVQGRDVGQPPLFVGSTPPDNDSLWESIRSRKCEVHTLGRNTQNKEKGVDVYLAGRVMKTLYKHTPGTIVLVAGDGDYASLIGLVLEEPNWQVEVWFWNQGNKSISCIQEHRHHHCKHSDNSAFESCYTSSPGLAYRLREQANGNCRVTIRELDDHYKQFTFAEVDRAPPGKRTVRLESIDNTVRDIKTPQLVDFFAPFGLFPCFSKLRKDNNDNIMELYVPASTNIKSFCQSCEACFSPATAWSVQ